MNVGVIDVGSNTVRLLLASVRGSQLRVIEERTAWIRLGSDIAAQGSITEPRLEAAANVVAGFANEARRREAASRTTVRVLRRDEEARLAYEGAVAAARLNGKTVAVCDVGGGSTQ